MLFKVFTVEFLNLCFSTVFANMALKLQFDHFKSRLLQILPLILNTVDRIIYAFLLF